MQTDDDFDLKLGEALRYFGIERAKEAKKDLLALGRHFCERAAKDRSDGTATADDAARGFKRYGFTVDCLGAASGALFREKKWVFTGQWRKSQRISNHAHQNRVWRLT